MCIVLLPGHPGHDVVVGHVGGGRDELHTLQHRHHHQNQHHRQRKTIVRNFYETSTHETFTHRQSTHETLTHRQSAREELVGS